MAIPQGCDLQVVAHTVAGYSSMTWCELILIEKGKTELDVKSGVFAYNHVALASRPTIDLLKEWAEQYDYPFPSGKDVILCQHSETMGGFVRRLHPIFNP